MFGFAFADKTEPLRRRQGNGHRRIPEVDENVPELSDRGPPHGYPVERKNHLVEDDDPLQVRHRFEQRRRRRAAGDGDFGLRVVGNQLA